MNTKLATIFVVAALTLSSTAARADTSDTSHTMNYLSEAVTQQADSVATEIANATRYALQQTMAEIKLAFSSKQDTAEIAALNTAVVATGNEE